MKKILFTLLALLTIMPISSQNLQKAIREKLVGKSDNSAMKTLPVIRASSAKMQPKSSLRYDYKINNEQPFKVTYDIFGHEISVIDPTNLTNQVEEYDVTGKILLNRYTETRTQPEAPWVKPDEYDMSTELNASGVRTALRHKDIENISLNSQGLVTSYKFKTETPNEIAEGTQTWRGNLLTGLTLHQLDKNGEDTKFNLRNIEMVYSTAELNPYDICYFNYLFDYTGNFWGINATGTMSQSNGEMTLTGNLIFETISERQPSSKYIKQTMTGNFSAPSYELNFNIFLYTYAPTDENGSYIFEDIQKDTRGNKTIYTYTVKCDRYGNVINNTMEERYNGTLTDSKIYRYDWSYDTEGKPLKIETYYKGEGEEEAISKEDFTEWYPATSINTTQTNIEGEILGATLYNLSGTPIRNVTVEEVNSTIELPAQGVYLLNIKTSKGNVVKKIMK